MTDYIVIKHDNIPDLMEIVNDFGKNGFVPCGGIAFDPSDNQYMQAMMKTYVTTGYWNVNNPSIEYPFRITTSHSGALPKRKRN